MIKVPRKRRTKKCEKIKEDNETGARLRSWFKPANTNQPVQKKRNEGSKVQTAKERLGLAEKDEEHKANEDRKRKEEFTKLRQRFEKTTETDKKLVKKKSDKSWIRVEVGMGCDKSFGKRKLSAREDLDKTDQNEDGFG